VPDHDSDLRRASELVAEAQRFVYEQKGKIIRLKTAGVDTSDAERTLQMFESNLKMFEEHRNALQSTRPWWSLRQSSDGADLHPKKMKEVPDLIGDAGMIRTCDLHGGAGTVPDGARFVCNSKFATDLLPHSWKENPKRAAIWKAGRPAVALKQRTPARN
jgi:hypothetical protein